VAALLRFAFKQKNMQGHIFPFESELQNNSQEAAPSSPSLSPTVSEKLERYAEALVAALSMSTIAETEHARSGVFGDPESVYRACADMKLFNQEVLRVVLLDARQRLITMIDVTKGGLNESLAHPREIFRPVISHSAYSFILVHNHPSGDSSPSEADLRLTRRISEAARILQIQLLDHVIIGQPMNDRQGYFSFKESGALG